MRKFLPWLTGLGVLLVALAFAFAWRSGWFPYEVYEFLSMGRYHRYDAQVVEVADRYKISPELLKAVIWRESRFKTHKIGSQGERGLMQVTEMAARDWAKAEKIETFRPADLFDPKVNIEVGTWYLQRALQHWAGKDNPVPFALAEYNAGRGRVKRWVRDSGQGETADAEALHAAMDFPGTKNYIAAITSRAEFYAQRAEFTKVPRSTIP